MNQNDEGLSRTRQRRLDGMIDAAQAVFSRFGLRGTTMEAIAAEAGVSKATLYAYFADKQHALEAVARRLTEQMRQVVDAALDGPGTRAERIAAALFAKHDLTLEIVVRSEHAAELLAARRGILWPVFEEADAAIEARIAEVVGEAGPVGMSPADTARLLAKASVGIGEETQSREELRIDLTRLVESVLR